MLNEYFFSKISFLFYITKYIQENHTQNTTKQIQIYDGLSHEICLEIFFSLL
ncbi:MAG: hypothetical protein RL329_2397 [Bacteroidota bacterium]|jgi:hypothetical protein